MNKLKTFLISSMVMGLSVLDAGSVRLINDSPFKLRVVIRANDNTFLGEMIINAQDTSAWTDGFQGLPGSLGTVRSQTPYRVMWYCLDGSAFSSVTGVANASTVAASNGDGPKECRGKNRQQQPGPQPAPAIPAPGEEQEQPPQYNNQQQPPPYPAPQQEYQNPRYETPDSEYTQPEDQNY